MLLWGWEPQPLLGCPGSGPDTAVAQDGAVSGPPLPLDNPLWGIGQECHTWSWGYVCVRIQVSPWAPGQSGLSAQCQDGATGLRAKPPHFTGPPQEYIREYFLLSINYLKIKNKIPQSTNTKWVKTN